jgi:hypothetical protein
MFLTDSFQARSVLITLLLASFTLLAARSAQAGRAGMNFACVNCHEGRSYPEVAATVSATRVEPGEAVAISVITTHPTASVGGVLVDSHEQGAFEILDPAETHLFEDVPTQATHAVPKPYTDGQVEFTFSWIAPETVGPVEFEVWANAANDNLEAHDDSASSTTANVAVGCDAVWYYTDEDSDGQGAEATRVYACEPVPERITQGGDCDDQNPEVNSGMTEVCNDIDDDCDGEVDEGFEKMLWVEDLDGDGFGASGGQSKIGCPPQPGFAPNFDDCDDTAANVNPNAVEIVNGIDDNCNGQRDEAPVATAGEGGGGSAAAGASSIPEEVPSGGATAVMMTGDVPATPAPSASADGPVGSAGVAAGSGPVPGVAAGESDSGGCAIRRVPSNAPVGVAVAGLGLAMALRRRRLQSTSVVETT